MRLLLANHSLKRIVLPGNKRSTTGFKNRFKEGRSSGKKKASTSSVGNNGTNLSLSTSPPCPIITIRTPSFRKFFIIIFSSFEISTFLSRKIKIDFCAPLRDPFSNLNRLSWINKIAFSKSASSLIFLLFWRTSIISDDVFNEPIFINTLGS